MRPDEEVAGYVCSFVILLVIVVTLLFVGQRLGWFYENKPPPLPQ